MLIIDAVGVTRPTNFRSLIWYEVDHDSCVLRKIEIFLDGRIVRDDIARYPDQASDFGFGTLIGDDFYSAHFEWPTAAEEDPVIVLDASAFEFEVVWARATP